MPKLTVFTLDGNKVTIADTPDESVAALIEGFKDEDCHTFAFTLDDGAGMTYIPRHAVARIDVDWPQDDAR